MKFNFKLEKEVILSEIESTGYIYKHRSGALLLYISNCDQNRVFSATFKTPAKDNTGIFHILEHCVLNGSKKYPIKDPFNELSKASIHSYLNAMTFRDKTMYPVAGTIESDFFKMMQVYLDATFFRLFTTEKRAFYKRDGTIG